MRCAASTTEEFQTTLEEAINKMHDGGADLIL